MGLHKLKQSTHNASGKSRWLLPAIVLLVAGLLLFGGDTTREWLRFDREGIRAGQVWRLVTGHFVHLGWPHFALNAAGLALVWTLVGGVFERSRWVLIAVISILTMDIGLWIFDPELMWYVGLSGLLHGILAAALLKKLRKPDKETLALTVLLIGKLAWEQLAGPLPGSEGTAGGAVVVDSHLFGTLGGILAAIWLRIRVRPAAPI
jgi:rhomboid family GlyGly-CTERM serine protease